MDRAGNVASFTVSGINIDETAPVLVAKRDTAANSYGWNNSDVAVSYSASDAMSGVASAASGTFTFAAEGANQSHTFTVTDLAGNLTSVTIGAVNIDKTAPTISGSPDRAANSHGWYNADVSVSFSGGDALSGVLMISSPKTLGEGANQFVTGTVMD